MTGLTQSIPCQTCGGTVTLESKRGATSFVEMVASCHGMHMVRIASTPADVPMVARDFLDGACRIRRELPEDNLDGGKPVKKRTRVHVGPKKAKEIDLGSLLNIKGKIGTITAKDEGTGWVEVSP
jgi:hypothetical protein